MINNVIKTIKLSNVSSTNDYLKELFRSGETGTVVAIAEEQTGGRGTRNRSFVSKKGGVYLSILVNAQNIGVDHTLITPMTAVAVSDTIEKISNISTDIKWVNDIYISGKKVSGILCESLFLNDGDGPFIIVGIGVNLFKPVGGFGEEIENIATYIFEEYNDSIKKEFIELLINNFFTYFNEIANKSFLEKYKNKNLILGKNIIISSEEVNVESKAIAIDDNCHLIVEFPNKTQKTISSGDVFVKI